MIYLQQNKNRAGFGTPPGWTPGTRTAGTSGARHGYNDRVGRAGIDVRSSDAHLLAHGATSEQLILHLTGNVKWYTALWSGLPKSPGLRKPGRLVPQTVGISARGGADGMDGMERGFGAPEDMVA